MTIWGAIRAFTADVAKASPLKLGELERQGVTPRLFNDLRSEMSLSSTRMVEIFKFQHTMLANKMKSNAPLIGREGQATLKMVFQNLITN